MHAFILHNIRSLLSPAYMGVAAIYLAFAWFLGDPSFDPSAIYSSERISSNYDLVLMSVMFINYFLFIIHHFKSEWRPARRDIIASRLTSSELYWGTIASYVIFFVIGFVLPAYGVAFIQQIAGAPGNVRLSIFILKATTGIVGYAPFWILCCIWCLSRFRNEFVCLIVMSLAYAASQFLNLISQGVWFDHYWFVNAIRADDPWSHLPSGLVWFAAMALSYVFGRRQEKMMLQVELNEPYRKGTLSRLAEWCHADLAMHHYQMMGLASQKVLMFFTAMGLLMLIPLLRRTDINLMPLAKVYIGAFIPLLFSFNQYFLIKVDRDAGMAHNNFLRELPYPRIILNRWLVLLAPQLVAQLVLVFTASAITRPFPLPFVLYILLLNILCSTANLYFAVATMTNAVANIFLSFVVYLQLRDDVQHFLESNSFFAHLNILGVLVQPDFQPILPVYWFVLGTLIIIFLLFTFRRLRNLTFGKIQFAG